MTFNMELDRFEKYVTEAVGEVPAELRAKIENLAFVVEEARRVPRAHEHGIKSRGILLGLYQGVPLPKRSVNYGSVLPDKITIFKQPVERLAGPDENNIIKLIKEVVHHEIAHYFGMDESKVRDWERKRKQKN